MVLGLFLSLGESFSDLKKQGQDQLMINQNIRFFARHFKKIYVFTYKKESIKLPQNCQLITPPLKLHRYLYGFLAPFIHLRIFKKIDIIRCYQLSGALPGIIAKIFFHKKFVFNLGYDYSQFAQIEGKPVQACLFSWLKPLALQLADRIIIKNKTMLKDLSLKIKRKTTFIQDGSCFKSNLKANC